MEDELRTSIFNLAFLGVMILQACQTTTLPQTVTRNESPGFQVGDLPNPARWKSDDLWRYFFGYGAQVFRERHDHGPHYSEHSLSSRVAAKCGDVLPFADPKWSNTRSISFYRKAKAETPKRMECWAKTGPELVERRGAEIEYLRTLLPVAANLPRAPGFAPNFLTEERPRRELSLDHELKEFERNMKLFAQADDVLNSRIRQAKGWQKQERESWARAASIAVHEFSQDNPLNKPGPGQSPTGTTTMSNMLVGMPNVSPGLKLAMANLDRSMMGDDAYFRVLNQKAIASANAAEAARQRSVNGVISLTACKEVELNHVRRRVCSQEERAAAEEANRRSSEHFERVQTEQNARRTAEDAKREALAAKYAAAREASLAAIAKCPMCR